MTTTKKRINISIPPKAEIVVRKLAERDKMPQATKIAELLQLALEIEEDYAWGELAGERDSRRAKFFSHKKAWT